MIDPTVKFSMQKISSYPVIQKKFNLMKEEDDEREKEEKAGIGDDRYTIVTIALACQLLTRHKNTYEHGERTEYVICNIKKHIDYDFLWTCVSRHQINLFLK
jgi:hypothetical protein